MNKARNVDEYVKNAPQQVQSKLKQIRSAIKSIAPKAEEKISYGMPYYSYKGRLIYFAYTKDHIGLYPMPPSIEDIKNELKKYQTGKATLSFPLNQDLPMALIKKVIKAGVKRNEEDKRGK